MKVIKNKKGFTLIELLAVIVILGLLMAIAIPSVTKYITQSRKKTVTTTIGNYISALTNQVNDMEYIFTATNTIYAVPIECVALERGGTDPFGEWYQANSVYWAYVLVQYDDKTSSYTYGFTFKDSAGYGLYPTTTEKLKESGSQINTDLDLNRPMSGSITNLTIKDNWTGFNLDDDTVLVVLEATSEGETGDGYNTCTLCQKGDNYADVEQDKNMRVSKLIREHNTLITSAPTLTTASNNSGDISGLYISTATNSGQPTYYFRGYLRNNYVKFAGFKWQIIRINEDGTIRLILDGQANGQLYNFSQTYNDYIYMYYSNSDVAKPIVDRWYEENIADNGYDSYVAVSMFCEQAKASYSSSLNLGNETVKIYSEHIPNFRCSNDENGKGIIYSKVGLISYDEAVYAGGYVGMPGSYHLLNWSYGLWTMSPAGTNSIGAGVWNIYTAGSLSHMYVKDSSVLRPVINLNANATATGTGTSSDPYVIQTN